VVFSRSLTPYVSFAEAMEKKETVQVKGYLAGPVGTMGGGYGISFVLRDDEGTAVNVVYAGAKPDNMEHSESVVVIGCYEDLKFNAEKILVKCPSKYQAEENV
jgi:cytochrome c-type biogenesis protein CcmE